MELLPSLDEPAAPDEVAPLAELDMPNALAV